jgi:hypothetical protein
MLILLGVIYITIPDDFRHQSTEKRLVIFLVESFRDIFDAH